MPTTGTPNRLRTDDDLVLAVTDSGCDGEVVTTSDGTLWEQVEDRPGEWHAPGTGRVARSVPMPTRCLMDDGGHGPAEPGFDLCPPCETAMAAVRATEGRPLIPATNDPATLILLALDAASAEVEDRIDPRDVGVARATALAILRAVLSDDGVSADLALDAARGGFALPTETRP